MKIQPVASPNAIHQAPSNAAEAKARAIAAFQSNGQPVQQPVQNQNAISPEELSAIQTPETRQEGTNTEEIQEVTAPVETKPAEDPALSRQFAQLARQEKAMRLKAQQQEQALKAREAALTAREAALTQQPKADYSGYISKDLLLQDPITALAEAGASYEEITNRILTQQPVDPMVKNTINQLKQEIQELKLANEQAKKNQEEQQTEAYRAAVVQIRRDTEHLVNTDPNFETIKATNSIKDVVDLIEQTYNKDKVLLTVEEAAQQVEDYLVEEGMKIARIEKIKKKLQSVAPTAVSKPAQTPAAPAQKQTQTMKTLTNATSSTRQLSAKERAILAFKGELGKG